MSVNGVVDPNAAVPTVADYLDHTVTHVEARFIPQTWTLPALGCLPPDEGQLRYDPRPENPVIIVVVQDEVQLGERIWVKDPCTLLELYYLDVYTRR